MESRGVRDQIFLATKVHSLSQSQYILKHAVYTVVFDTVQAYGYHYQTEGFLCRQQPQGHARQVRLSPRTSSQVQADLVFSVTDSLKKLRTE